MSKISNQIALYFLLNQNQTKVQQLPFTDHMADKSALGLTLVLVDILKYFFGDRDHQLCMNVPCKYALFSARGPYIQLHSGLLYVTQLYYHAFCNSKSVCLCTRQSTSQSTRKEPAKQGFGHVISVPNFDLFCHIIKRL